MIYAHHLASAADSLGDPDAVVVVPYPAVDREAVVAPPMMVVVPVFPMVMVMPWLGCRGLRGPDA